MIFRKSRAISNCVSAVEQSLAMLKLNQGELPSDIWRNPYALGYMNGVMANFAILTLGSGAKKEERAKVLIQAWQKLLGIRSTEVIDRIIELGRTQNVEYYEGGLAAEKVFAVAYRLPDFDDDDEVIAARKLAKALSGDMNSIGIGGNSDYEGASGVLAMKLFVDRLRPVAELKRNDCD